MKTNQRSVAVQQWINEHPVAKSFHTGKYGFERNLDGINLNACIYATRKAAEMARAHQADAARKQDEELVASLPPEAFER